MPDCTIAPHENHLRTVRWCDRRRRHDAHRIACHSRRASYHPLFAVCFLIVAGPAGEISPLGTWPLYVLAALFVVVALACFSAGSHPVSLRIVGGVVFVAYLAGTILFLSKGQPSGFRIVVGERQR